MSEVALASFDGTLARRLAGHSFRRADTVRDERLDQVEKPVEDFLRRWLYLRPAASARTAAIDEFAQAVAAAATTLPELPDAEVVDRFNHCSVRLRQKPLDRGQLALAFALIGEASRRRLGMWPHPVQFYGALVLLQGRLAEMQTGEGKTLVAALAATAMAACGGSVHVVSTNDYLARRDAEEMSPLFSFFGLSAGSIQQDMEPSTRQQQYRQPICYVSGKELVFDYLKDRLAGHGYLPAGVDTARRVITPGSAPATPLIPALHFAIVDEADSVLIDESRTPMIISREAEGLYEKPLLEWVLREARKLEQGRHFSLSANRTIEIFPGTVAACGDPPPSVRHMWSRARWKAMLLQQTLSALHLFSKDQHYIIAEGKIQIVDESTGRVMPDRSWEQGLHQLIECKEGLELTSGRETIARMTFQRFFRKYFLFCGLTGTAAEAARELWGVYGLKVERIPPNRLRQRRELPAMCLPDAVQKWERVADEVGTAGARGQPVLVGTRSVEASEAIAAVLARRGVEHVVLNARQDQDEAAIVKLAGRRGAVTVATNMAGRGTDIKLDEAARAAGGLHVILTEYHGSARVDRQLFGRSGRQGDAGTVRAIVAADDDLFRQYLPRAFERGLGTIALPPPIQRLALRLMLALAQWRSESQARRTRMQTFKNDQTLHRLLGFAGKTI